MLARHAVHPRVVEHHGPAGAVRDGPNRLRGTATSVARTRSGTRLEAAHQLRATVA
jgi:hypothetical protein